MIFSYLNTFIQFIAAIYVTIALDDIIFHRFWAPNLVSSTKKILKTHNLNDNKFLEKELYPAIETRFQVLESNSRKRGFINIYVCLFFLVYNALLCINDFTSSQYPFLIYCITLILDYAIMVLTSVYFKRWRWFVICIGILFVFNCLGISIATSEYFVAPSILSISKVSKILITTGLMISPILFQLGQSWMYSEGYRHYLDLEMFKESKLFTQAKKAKEEHDDNLMPDEYKPYFASAQEVRTSDFLMTQLNKGLCERLKGICCNFTILDILGSLFKNSGLEGSNMKHEKLSDEDESVDKSKVSEIDYASYVQKYNQLKPRPKIDEFCKSHSIDMIHFKQNWSQYSRDLSRHNRNNPKIG